MTPGKKTISLPDKRRHPRVETFNTVKFILFDSKKKKIGHGKGSTVNLSQSGVLLQSESKLEGAFIVLMAIDLDGNEIKFNGKIKSSRICKKTNSYLTGIEFIGPKDKQLLAVTVFVKDFQRRKYIKSQKQTEEQLRLLSSAIGQSSEGIVITDLDGNITYLNNALSEMHGYSPDELIRRSLSIFHNKEQMKTVNTAIRKMKQTGHFKGEIWHQRSDGTIFPTVMYYSIIKDDAGNSIGMIGTVRDITQQKGAEDALRESEERYRLVMENINDAVFICKLDGHLKYMSPSMVRLTGYSSNEMLNVHYLHFIHPDFRKHALEFYIKQVQEKIEVTEHEYPFLAKGGRIIWIGQTVRMVRNNNGEIEFFGVIRDITSRKQAEEALRESEERYRELSIIDDLTHLYNSRHFYNQLQMEIDRVNRYDESLTIILLDIDNFKKFNDRHGHIAGDQVLMRLGQMTKKCLRNTDSAYRYGGEEFTIILPETLCEDGVITADRLRSEFKKENFSPVSGKEIHMTLSFGVGQYKPQEDLKAFIHRVDQLMYQAKKNGKDRVCYELKDLSSPSIQYSN